MATCPRETRNEVIRFLHDVTAADIGLPALRALFPQVPRCILEDLLCRYRRVWRRRYRRRGFRLTWHVAGSVWAMDFSEAPYLIDGVYQYLFALRDLASRYQLAWFPVPDEKAETIRPLLGQLFQEFGPPLVLKSDNGSGFIAQVLRKWLSTQQVSQLFSPARHPQYNGALERSNGVLKTYTGVHAIQEGHPFRWTSDDLEHARQLANTISRPWGHKGPTPAEAWQARQPLTGEQRRAFLDSVQTHLPQAAADQGLPDIRSLSALQHRMASRMAISRALCQLDYLSMKRTRRHKRQRAPAPAPSETPCSSSSTVSNDEPGAPRTARRSPEHATVASSTPSSNDGATGTAANAPTADATGAPTPDVAGPPTADIAGAPMADARPSNSKREKNPAALLAPSTARDTMAIGTDDQRDDSTDGQPRGSPHGERTIYSWLWRLFTPALRNKKAAKIP